MSARPAQKPVPRPVSQPPAKKKPVSSNPNLPTKKPAPTPRTTPAQKPVPRAPAPQTKKPAPTPPTSQSKKPASAPRAKAPAPSGGGVSGAATKALSKAKPTIPAADEPKAGNWINRTVQERVAGIGSYAGGLVNSVGDSVNAVGAGIGNRYVFPSSLLPSVLLDSTDRCLNSITNTTRYWGQGVAGYGNDLKDTVGAGGPRVPVAGNPLGLGGMGSGKGALPGGKQPQPATRNPGKGGAGNPLGL